MDDSEVWNKFSMKIIGYCNCGGDERRIRRCLKTFQNTHLISIDLEKGAFTVSTIHHPFHLIQSLQNHLNKQVTINLHDQQDSMPIKSAAANIIDADQIPEFLDKVSRNGNVNAVDVCIRFDLKDRLGSSSSDVDRTPVSMVGHASPPLLPPPPIRPSAPKLAEEKAYGYPITTRSVVHRPPNSNYYYYGTSSSSDDYPKDYYSCNIL